MAQNVTIAGAAFSAVPAIEVPKTGGGIATFADPSGTTATASDVAQGKLFLDSSGVLTTGTASGGGGTFTPKFGVIRPDAELVYKWTYDKKYVADLGNTIPSYTTSRTTLISSEALTPAITPSNDYVYFVLYRTIVYPIYSTTSRGYGYEEYMFSISAYERIVAKPGVIKNASGIAHNSPLTFMLPCGSTSQIIYNSGSTSISVGNSPQYGFRTSIDAPTTKMNISSPYLFFRGSSTYMSSTAWEYVTDVRFMYVVEVYRYPNNENELDGWTGQMQMMRAIDCFNNGGTLT